MICSHFSVDSTNPVVGIADTACMLPIATTGLEALSIPQSVFPTLTPFNLHAVQRGSLLRFLIPGNGWTAQPPGSSHLGNWPYDRART